jgi:hypothetical protein
MTFFNVKLAWLDTGYHLRKPSSLIRRRTPTPLDSHPFVLLYCTVYAVYAVYGDSDRLVPFFSGGYLTLLPKILIGGEAPWLLLLHLLKVLILGCGAFLGFASQPFPLAFLSYRKTLFEY